MSGPRVVIAHDYVTQRGGAERTVLGLLRAFPGSRLVTSVYNPAGSFPEFRDVDVTTSPLDRVAAFRRDPRFAFPLLARTWERLEVSDADVVIASSSGWAHAVRTDAVKVVYCHNPARWLYQADDYLTGHPRPIRAMRHSLAERLIDWDRRHASGAAAYVANSSVVAGRILEQYGRDSVVIPPPVTLDADGPHEPVPGLRPGFLLTVSRSRGYKNTRVVCDAVESMPEERLVAIGSLPEPTGTSWSGRLTGVGRVSDAQLRWLYANCKAVVSASREDFGLTPLEGNGFGKPAVLLRAGGFLDTLVEGMTGCFIEEEAVDAVRDALERIPDVDPDVLRIYARGFGQAAFGRRMHQVVADALTPATVSMPQQGSVVEAPIRLRPATEPTGPLEPTT